MKDSSLRHGFGSSFLRRFRRNRLTAGAPRRRSRQIHLEFLEDRIALSTTGIKSSALLVHAVSTPKGSAAGTQAAVQAAQQLLNGIVSPTAQVMPDGNVLVNGADGATQQEYQKLSSGWKLIGWAGYGLPLVFQTQKVFIAQSWGLDGSLTEDIWNSQTHGAPGSTSQFAQLLVQKGQITLTLYHAAGYTIYNGLLTKPSWDATVTWTFARTANGGVGNVLQYHVDQSDSSFAADWKSPTVYPHSGYYLDGWLEYYPYDYSLPVPSPLNQGLMAHVNQMAVYANTGNAPIPLPQGLTETQQTLNGHPAETFWDSSHTSSVTFVYQGQAKQTLISQIYGTTADGKWVTTTTHNKAFISQTATYNKQGGTLESSVTTFTAANGQTATLNGTWTRGTAVDKATGFETGDNYLGFSSVTIQVQNGRPVTRYGVLGEDQLGMYAKDTFNSSGTRVIKREVLTSPSSTSPVAQTWTGTHRNLTIVWNTPNKDTMTDTFQYVWDGSANTPRYKLMRFNALFTKPLTLNIVHDTETISTRTYTWWVIAGPAYRQEGDNGAIWNARSYPSLSVNYLEPPMDNYWDVP